jgi:hypothetical protein
MPITLLKLISTQFKTLTGVIKAETQARTFILK